MTTSWVAEQWAVLPLRTVKNPKSEQPAAVLGPGRGEAARLGSIARSQGWDTTAWSRSRAGRAPKKAAVTPSMLPYVTVTWHLWMPVPSML